MVHQSTRCKKLQRVFYCSILRRHDLVYRQGYSNRAAVRKCRKERHSAAFLMEDGTVFQAYYFNEDKILK